MPERAAADPSDIVAQERQRRAENIKTAREALVEGDRAYRLGEYEEAVQSYTRARDLLPESTLTSRDRALATERLAQAAVERARALAKTGRVAEADSLLESVLARDVAPGYAPAAQMREQIHDPIRYNQALTAEHVANIDKVRRLLYEAQGFADLGQYDRAQAFYEDVLRIDRYNTAARRGMEALAQHKRSYAAAAHDETRASMLTAVDGAWETSVPPPILDLESDLGEIRDPSLLGGASPAEKLASIILPVVDMDQVNLEDAIDFLRQQSISSDLFEPVPERRGVAFVIDLGSADPERSRTILSKRFDLRLRNIPLGKVVEYITNATGTDARNDQHAVVIRPAGVVSDDFVQKKFRVPPDFLSRESVEDAGGNADPFGDDPDPNQGIPRRLTALEFLKNNGVAFPPGASATFSSSGGILTVHNTETNMRIVEAIVEVIAETEPVMITVEARIIRSTQKILEELSFDWLIGTPQISGDGYLGGGSVGNGTPVTTSPFIRPITAGNRSGNLATEQNSIDAVLNRGPTNENLLRAPGAVQAFGFIDDEVLAVLMRGVNQHTGIDLVTKKSVITRPGQAATIHSVQEFIYPTEYEPPELPNQTGSQLIDPVTGLAVGSSSSAIATPATPTAFTTTNLGCMLEVLPQLSSDRRMVEVAIKPQIRRFDGFINYGTPIQGGSSTTLNTILGPLTGGNFGQITDNAILMPVISTMRGDSTLSIADGETVVMGGLLSHSRIKVEDRTPVLSSIPLIGRFFESEAYTSVQDAFVILITVRLMDPAGEPINPR